MDYENIVNWYPNILCTAIIATTWLIKFIKYDILFHYNFISTASKWNIFILSIWYHHVNIYMVLTQTLIAVYIWKQVYLQTNLNGHK